MLHISYCTQGYYVYLHHNGKSSAQEGQPAVDAQRLGSFLEEREHRCDQHLEHTSTTQCGVFQSAYVQTPFIRRLVDKLILPEACFSLPKLVQ